MPYTIDRDTPHQQDYKGFSRWTGKADRIVIAHFDGEPDLYDVDAGAALAEVREEIERFYRRDFDRGPESINFYVNSDFVKRIIDAA